MGKVAISFLVGIAISILGNLLFTRGADYPAWIALLLSLIAYGYAIASAASAAKRFLLPSRRR